MELLDVYVQAKTVDDRWATVNAVSLDERSFRRLVLSALAAAGSFSAIPSEDYVLRTPLTKDQAEGE